MARNKKQKSAAAIDAQYRNLKKYLNKYHKFSFAMPPKGKTFTAQQKSAITRQLNKVGYNIEKTAQEKQSFIPYPKGNKLKDIDGVRTNKGIFYKFQGATAAKVTTTQKNGKKKVSYTVQINYRHLKEIFLAFPLPILYDIVRIKEWVKKQAKKYKPDYIMFSSYGTKSRNLYDPDAFDLYVTDMQLTKDDKRTEYALKNLPTYNGVFFGWQN